MTKLLEQVLAEATKLPPAEQEAVARRWLQELAQREQDRQQSLTELMRLIDEAAEMARPEPGWRFSREETHERTDRFPR